MDGQLPDFPRGLGLPPSACKNLEAAACASSAGRTGVFACQEIVGWQPLCLKVPAADLRRWPGRAGPAMGGGQGVLPCL